MIRLCANAGAALHLIRPLGFRLDEKSLRRAGLDYRSLADVTVHADFASCLSALSHPRWYALSTRGTRHHDAAGFRAGDLLVFGPESRGLPPPVLESCPERHRLRIPMRAGARSLNLANAVAIVVYEAWRQLRYEGSVSPTPP